MSITSLFNLFSFFRFSLSLAKKNEKKDKLKKNNFPGILVKNFISQFWKLFWTDHGWHPAVVDNVV